MKGKGQQNKWMKILTLPFRFLKKGKDMYVRSMMDVAQKPRQGSSHLMKRGKSKSSAAAQVGGLPKSFSTSVSSSWSSNLEGDDLRELIRANSTNPTSKLREDMEVYLKQVVREQQVKKLQLSVENIHNNNINNNGKFSKGLVPRSVSVGMGKIDEEMPFEEDEEEEEMVEDYGLKKEKKSLVMFPRSKSHAVTQSSVIF